MSKRHRGAFKPLSGSIRVHNTPYKLVSIIPPGILSTGSHISWHNTIVIYSLVTSSFFKLGHLTSFIIYRFRKSSHQHYVRVQS